MNRTAKVPLLTKVLQKVASQTNRQRLQQAIENAPRSLTLIDDLDFEPNQAITDDDPVSFQDRDIHHQMTLREAQQYARRYQLQTLFILSAKHKI